MINIINNGIMSISLILILKRKLLLVSDLTTIHHLPSKNLIVNTTLHLIWLPYPSS